MKALRIIASSLIVASLASVLVACSSSSGGASSSEVSSTATSEASASTSSSENAAIESSASTAEAEPIDSSVYIGTWDVVSSTNSETGATAGEADFAKVRELGKDYFLNIEEDGTCSLVTEGKLSGSSQWTEVEPGVLQVDTLSMAISGDEAVLVSGDKKTTMVLRKSTEKKEVPAAEDASSDAEAQSVGETTEQSEEQTPASDGRIDSEKFNAINQGMTYEEVVAIIGSEGELQASNEVAGVETASYLWQSDGWGIATVMFQDGVVVNKTQAGMGESGAKMTMEAFNSIENGMTYEQVVEIAGGEGSLMSETELMGITSTVYTWDGNAAFSNCTITFQDGEVTSKSQFGLE